MNTPLLVSGDDPNVIPSLSSTGLNDEDGISGESVGGSFTRILREAAGVVVPSAHGNAHAHGNAITSTAAYADYSYMDISSTTPTPTTIPTTTPTPTKTAFWNSLKTVISGTICFLSIGLVWSSFMSNDWLHTVIRLSTSSTSSTTTDLTLATLLQQDISMGLGHLLSRIYHVNHNNHNDVATTPLFIMSLIFTIILPVIIILIVNPFQWYQHTIIHNTTTSPNTINTINTISDPTNMLLKMSFFILYWLIGYDIIFTSLSYDHSTSSQSYLTLESPIIQHSTGFWLFGLGITTASIFRIIHIMCFYQHQHQHHTHTNQQNAKQQQQQQQQRENQTQHQQNYDYDDNNIVMRVLEEDQEIVIEQQGQGQHNNTSTIVLTQQQLQSSTTTTTPTTTNLSLWKRLLVFETGLISILAMLATMLPSLHMIQWEYNGLLLVPFLPSTFTQQHLFHFTSFFKWYWNENPSPSSSSLWSLAIWLLLLIQLLIAPIIVWILAVTTWWYKDNNNTNTLSASASASASASSSLLQQQRRTKLLLAWNVLANSNAFALAVAMGFPILSAIIPQLILLWGPGAQGSYHANHNIWLNLRVDILAGTYAWMIHAVALDIFVMLTLRWGLTTTQTTITTTTTERPQQQQQQIFIGESTI